MALHHTVKRQHTATPMESPAKVFAKLKSKAQQEAMLVNRGRCLDYDTLTPRSAGQRHGPEVHTPPGSGNRMIEQTESSGLGSSDAEALTLSPAPTPPRSDGCTYMDLSAISPPRVSDAPRPRPAAEAVLESTALPRSPQRPISLLPPSMRGCGAFDAAHRVPPKPIAGLYGRSVFADRALPAEKRMSPAKVFGSMKKGLRKRTWEQQTNTPGAKDPVHLPKERKVLAVLNHENREEEVVVRRGGPSAPSRTVPIPQELFVLPGTPVSKQRNDPPRLSHARTFAPIRAQENTRTQQEEQLVSSTQDPTKTGQLQHMEDSLVSSILPENETMDGAVLSSTQSKLVVSPSSPETGDSPPDRPQQRVLLEDPLVLQSPQVSIPSRRTAAQRDRRRPQNFPKEDMIHLKSWIVEHSRNGLYVDGIIRDDGTPWHSNIIVERMSNSVLRTVSGRLYFLVGRMSSSVPSVLPKWFLKKFLTGFPKNWKSLYEKYLQDLNDKKTGQSHQQTKSSAAVKTTKVARPSRGDKTRLETTASCPSHPSVSISVLSLAKVSRSGRTIKPPLEYWRGGRVLLDADMNVTIHECYNTSITPLDVTSSVSANMMDNSAAFLPHSPQDQDEPPTLLRKVKAPPRRRTQARAAEDKKPSRPAQHANAVPGPHRGGEEGADSRRTQPCRVAPLRERDVCGGGAREQEDRANRCSARLAQRGQSGSPVERDAASLSRLDAAAKTQQRAETAKVKAPPRRKSPQDTERRRRDRDKAPQKKTKHRPSKHSKTSPPPPALPPAEPKHAGKKPTSNKGRTKASRQDEDEDEWTQEELTKLQEAVSSCPKHARGYWAKVALLVGSRTAEECQKQQASQGAPPTPCQRHKRAAKAKATTDAGCPVISSRVGTLKRKQQVRQFLEAMPKDDMDDVFSSAYMQSKRHELPSMSSSDQDFVLSDIEPVSPTVVTGFPEVKTPQCVPITPGMMGSPSRTNDDKYVYQLQKRMKRSQFNVRKQDPVARAFTTTPSTKRSMRRCANTENDTFVVWEMFADKPAVPSDSGEEEDYYFSDCD